MEPLNRMGSPSCEPEARLIDLLSAAAPTALPDSQKRASLAAILSPEPPRSKARFRLARPALVFGTLFFLAGASAVAALGARWIVERQPAAAPAVGRPAAQPPTTVRSRPMIAPAPELDPSAEEAPGVPLTTPTRRSVVRSPRPHQGHGENPSAVMDAVKALRQDHDPLEARRLLQEYLSLYPHGSLAEEARALSFEAARAAHSPDAVALANGYLTLYPHGRFQKAAEQAARGSKP